MRGTIAMLLAGALLLAGCGGDDDEKEPVDAQLKGQLTEIDARMNKQLEPIFAALKKAGVEAQVPSAVRADVRKFTSSQQKSASELDKLSGGAPGDVKSDVEGWAQGLRDNSGALKTTVAEKDLTARRLVETIIAGTSPSVGELRKKGYLPPGQ